MTDDVIRDVTAEFIKGSKENLKLALEVERAMPSVREHYVGEVLNAVEKCFREREWAVDRSKMHNVMAKGASLVFRREAWTANEGDPAIWLGSDKPNWGNVWIGLYFAGESSQKVQPIEQMVAPLTDSGYSVDPSEAAPGAYKYLKGELRDWSVEGFLTRFWEENGLGQIAEEIFAELKKIDDIVQDPSK